MASKATLVELGACVQRIIVASSMRSGQRLQRAPGRRKALRQVQPVQQHRVVARKVRTASSTSTRRPAVADLRVGGVDVDHVDLAAGHRVVGQAMVQPLRALRQRIAPRQPGPAVGAADEFVAQAQAQRPGGAPGPTAADAQLRGHVGAHRQRITVVEAQRHVHAQAQRRQPLAHRGQRQAAGPSGSPARWCRCIRGRRRCAAAQRLVGDGGVAQAGLHLHRAVRRAVCASSSARM
jgi:hypothetical protein